MSTTRDDDVTVVATEVDLGRAESVRRTAVVQAGLPLDTENLGLFYIVRTSDGGLF